MTEYAKSVRRFGGPDPYIDEVGNKRNLNHETDFPPSEVITDGAGNITRMPLLKRKPCFARPERHLRGLFEGQVYKKADGTKLTSLTSCTRCEIKSKGVFRACRDVMDERIASDPSINRTANVWFDFADKSPIEKLWIGRAGIAWSKYLGAIEDHGGWTSINDIQVRADRLLNEERKRREKKEKAREQRFKEKLARKGVTKEVTPDFVKALDAERDKRSKILKRLRLANFRNKSEARRFSILTDATCERRAAVWWARRLLLRHRGAAKGTEIAGLLQAKGLFTTMGRQTLENHVSRDLKQIAAYEDDTNGEPLWPKWDYIDPPVTP